MLNIIQRFGCMDKIGGKRTGSSKKPQDIPHLTGAGNLFTFFNTLSKNDEEMTPEEVKNIDITV